MSVKKNSKWETALQNSEELELKTLKQKMLFLNKNFFYLYGKYIQFDELKFEKI